MAVAQIHVTHSIEHISSCYKFLLQNANLYHRLNYHHCTLTCHIQLCNMPGTKSLVLNTPVLSCVKEFHRMYGQVIRWVINGASLLILAGKASVIYMIDILLHRTSVIPQHTIWCVRCMTFYSDRLANRNILVLMKHLLCVQTHNIAYTSNTQRINSNNTGMQTVTTNKIICLQLKQINKQTLFLFLLILANVRPNLEYCSLVWHESGGEMQIQTGHWNGSHAIFLNFFH